MELLIILHQKLLIICIVIENLRYDEKCDIWSAGVILFILLCGYPPFNGEDDEIIMNAVKKGVYSFDSAEWEALIILFRMSLVKLKN